MGKNMIIGQSGGPTVAINATLSGAIQQAMRSPEIKEIYGMVHGLQGALKGNIIELRKDLKSLEDFSRLEATPAAALGSCRFKMPLFPDPTYDLLSNIFKQLDIGYFFYIGGNDSMDTVQKLSLYFAATGQDVKCVGIPKTVDNDLPRTDHTPGFGSAARYIATSVAEVLRDVQVYDAPSVTILEIMGRNAGWLTAASALARRAGGAAPHIICLPEVPFDSDGFVAKCKELVEKERNVVVTVSEGICGADGSYVASAGASITDAFGHQVLAGSAKHLESLLRSELDCKAKAVELSVLQRAAAHYSSGTDLREANRIGSEAVSFALAGKTGGMVVFHRVSNNPYLISYDWAAIGEVANLERKVPLEWITPDGWDVTQEMIDYLLPLVQGSVKMFFTDGIPCFFSFGMENVKLEL